MIELTTPISEEQIRTLKVGDSVAISGVVFTGRDAVHKYLHEGGELPEGVNLEGSIIYHCGPVVVKDDAGKWKVTAAGPTTSIREEPYQADIMKKFGVRGVIGKGGMGPMLVPSFFPVSESTEFCRRKPRFVASVTAARAVSPNSI